MWALSSARLERRSYMANCRSWQKGARITGGRRFKSARAHFFSFLLTFSLFFVILFFPYILLTSFNFLPNEKANFVISCISTSNCSDGENLGFREEEINHLIDVKNLLIIIKFLFFFFFSLFLIFFPFYKIQKKFLFFLTLLFLLFFLLAAFNFKTSFSLFHKIFFKQNYEFPSSYVLIQIYPEKFFLFSFIFSSIFSLAILTIFILLS